VIFNRYPRSDDDPNDTALPQFATNLAATPDFAASNMQAMPDMGSGMGSTGVAEPPPVDMKPSARADSMDKAKGIDPIAGGPPMPPPGMGAPPMPPQLNTGGDGGVLEPGSSNMPPIPPGLQGAPPPPARPKSKAEQYQDQYDALVKPEEKKPGIWQKLAAAGLGAAAGYSNVNPVNNHIDPSAATNLIMKGPKFLKDEHDYEEKKADLQNKIKLADQVENIGSMADTRLTNADTRKTNAEQRVITEKDRVKAAQITEQDRQNKVEQDLSARGGTRVPLNTPIQGQEPGPDGGPRYVEIHDPLHELGPDGKPAFKVILDKAHGYTKVTPQQAELSSGALAAGSWVPQSKDPLSSVMQAGVGKYDPKNVKDPNITADLLAVRSQGGKTGNAMVDQMTPEVAGAALEKKKVRPPGESNAGTTALDRETKQFGTKHEKAFADANTQLDKINDAAMMVRGNAMDQALGVPKVMTALISGAGSGVRITAPELAAIAHARGIMGDIEGTLRSWAGQGKLTPLQQQQLSGVLEDVKQRVIQKRQIANDAMDGIYGATDRNGIIAADKTARDAIMRMENPERSQGGGGRPQTGGGQQGGPPPPQQGGGGNTGYIVGHKYGGLTYLGGDINNGASWKK
jgi:hypothetical protein